MQPTKPLPKEGRKKGWHLPFPWLWNPTGSKLFEVLFREETVIASTLKRRKMPLYTDHGGSDLSGESKRAGCELEVRPACQERHEGLCAKGTQQELGPWSQETPRKGKEFSSLTQCLSTAPWLPASSSFPWFFCFLSSSHFPVLLKKQQRAPRLRAGKLMKVSSCWSESLQRNEMTQCPRCSLGELWAHSVAVTGDSNTKNMQHPVGRTFLMMPLPPILLSSSAPQGGFEACEGHFLYPPSPQMLSDKALLRLLLPLKLGPDGDGWRSLVTHYWDVGWLGRWQRKVMSRMVKPPRSTSSLGSRHWLDGQGPLTKAQHLLLWEQWDGLLESKEDELWAKKFCLHHPTYSTTLYIYI